MIRIHHFLPALLLALALASLPLVPAPRSAEAGELTREQQIADIERQIADLNKRLEALRKAPAPAPKPTLPTPTLPAEWTRALHWRCVGPASMGGRIVALAVNEADPSNYWVATASGGLLKTINNGVTFVHQFDRQDTVSIGDVAVAPSNPSIVWVGTGENNPRNSVSWGDGVYKSTDGGSTWQNVGLRKTFQIGRIAIHPRNPDVVYVGALGRLYGPSEERGLYRTSDGGKTWTKILYVDENTGVIDLRMHPTDPETLLVATWERRRDGHDSHAGAIAGQGRPGAKVEPPLEEGHDAYDPIKKWGKGSGIWKTTNGGKTFARITRGLPTCAMGRIGIDFHRKDPKVVFAVVDCEKIAMGRVPGFAGISHQNAKIEGARLTRVVEKSPADVAGLKVGDLITLVEKTGIKSSDGLSAALGSRNPGDRVTIGLLRDGKPMTVTITLAESPELGGRRPGLDLQGEDGSGGVRVRTLFARGPSAQAGIQVGDVITLLDKQKITTVKQLADAYRAAPPGTRLALTVQRGKESKPIVVVLPERRRRITRPYALRYGGQRENAQDRQGPDGHEFGGVYRSSDGGDTWTRVNSVNPRPMYFSQIRVDPSDPRLVYVLGINLYRSTDGGKTFATGGDAEVHVDHHAMWIDPRDGRHLLIGTDGGTYVTYDRCGKWDYLNTMAIGQFYHVCVDSRRPYRIYGGMQDNGSWGGPSRTFDGRGPINADWVMVQGGDGFVCRVDPSDPDIVYSESQEGNMRRTDLRTGNVSFLKPRAPEGQQPYRFNWNTPFVISAHNPRITYCAGNHVFRSTKRGNEPKVISPELTRSSKGSASALGESPRNQDVLWVGTDDGNLWVTRDGGGKWENVAGKVGLARPFWVATVEPSRFVEGRCYVSFDGHRSDDDRPHVYATEDFGQTWRSLGKGLPAGSSRCLREDLYNADVLYLGTEFAVWASIDQGTTWTRINNNLPTVAVHELAQHPTAGEMVAATHGRSLWILDVSALRQLKPAMTKAPATLLAPTTAVRWKRDLPRRTIYGNGNREYFGENPEAGAHVYYALTTKASKVRLEVKDYAGKTVATMPGKTEPGLHRLTWDLRGSATTGLGLEGLIPSRFLRMMATDPGAVPAGPYRVVLRVDQSEQAQGLRVENDPTLPAGTITTEEEAVRKKTDVED